MCSYLSLSTRFRIYISSGIYKIARRLPQKIQLYLEPDLSFQLIWNPK